MDNYDIRDRPWWQFLPLALGMPIDAAHDRMIDRPIVTWGFCAALVFAFVVTSSSGATNYGFVPEQLSLFSAVTYAFMHADVLHLLGNVYGLLVFGTRVEDFIGRRRMLGMIIGGAILSALIHGLGDPRSSIPLIGASGVVSACLVAYVLLFPRRRLIFFLAMIPVRGSAWLFFVFWFIGQFALAQRQIEGLTSISALGHLGGMLAGFIFWLWVRRRLVRHDVPAGSAARLSSGTDKPATLSN